MTSTINSIQTTHARKPGGTVARIGVSTDGGTSYKNVTSADAVDNTGCYWLDGTDDYFTAPSASCDISSDFTVAIWIKKENAASDNDRMFSFLDDANNHFQLITDNATQKYTAHLVRSGSATINQLTYGPITLDEWVHVVYTVSSSTGTFYLNGIAVASDGSTGVGSGTTYNYRIGARGDGTATAFFQGHLDDARVYSVALTAAEAWDLYAKGQDDQSANLTSHWKFDVGDTLGDSAGTNDLTANSSPVSVTDWSNLPPLGEALSSGQGGGDHDVLSFDGTNDYADVADNAALDIDSNLTLSAWVYFYSWGVPTDQSIIEKGNAGAPRQNYALRVLSGDIRLYAYNGGWLNAWADDVLTLNTWHHIAATYDEVTPKIYVDGQSVTIGSDSLTTFITNNDSLAIGRAGEHSSGYVDGLIKPAAIWNDIRTAAEIETSFLNGYEDNSDANLVGYWPLDEGTGNTLDNDEGTAALDLDMTGHAGTWTQDIYSPGDATADTLTADASFTGVSTFEYRIWGISHHHDRAFALDQLVLDYTSEDVFSTQLLGCNF